MNGRLIGFVMSRRRATASSPPVRTILGAGWATSEFVAYLFSRRSKCVGVAGRAGPSDCRTMRDGWQWRPWRSVRQVRLIDSQSVQLIKHEPPPAPPAAAAAATIEPHPFLILISSIAAFPSRFRLYDIMAEQIIRFPLPRNCVSAARCNNHKANAKSRITRITFIHHQTRRKRQNKLASHICEKRICLLFLP